MRSGFHTIVNSYSISFITSPVCVQSACSHCKFDRRPDCCQVGFPTLPVRCRLASQEERQIPYLGTVASHHTLPFRLPQFASKEKVLYRLRRLSTATLFCRHPRLVDPVQIVVSQRRRQVPEPSCDCLQLCYVRLWIQVFPRPQSGRVADQHVPFALCRHVLHAAPHADNSSSLGRAR